MTPDQLVTADDWSDLAAQRGLPEIDHDRISGDREPTTE